MERNSSARRLENLRKALLLLVPLVYAAVLSFSFSGEWFPVDDAQELFFVRGTESFSSLFGRDVFGLFRPVKNLIFLLLVRLEPFGVNACRLVGLAIGILSFFPVLALCRRIFSDEWKALAAASVWLLSPTLVSSAVWASCLNIRAMVAFACLAVALHDSAWDCGTFRPFRLFLSDVCFFFSLVSYECAIALLPVFLCFDAVLRPGRLSTRNGRWSFAVHVAVAVLYLTLRTEINAASQVSGFFSGVERWQLVVSSPCFYAWHFFCWFWPFGSFAAFGSYIWGDVSWLVLILCGAIFIGLFLFSVAERKKFPRLCFCILFTLFAFAPVSNCLGLGSGPYGDYYIALSSVGIAAASIETAALLLKLRGRGRAVSVAAVAMFAASRVAAVPEAARWAWLWSRGEAALLESIRNVPTAFSNKRLLAPILHDAGHIEEALELGRQIEEAVGSDSPQMRDIHLMRALHALRSGKDAERAFLEIERCARADPAGDTEKTRHYYKGCIFEDLVGDEDAAREEYGKALAGIWTSDLVPCADRLARLDAIRGELASAIALWEKALRLDPGNNSVVWNLSVAYENAGKREQAEVLRIRARRTMDLKRTTPAQ